MTDLVTVLVTAPGVNVAEGLAEALVGERLAACVNVVPNVASIYRWEGAVERADEVLLVVKTRAALLESLERRVAELHPYDVPEVLALPVLGGSDDYMGWVRGATAEGGRAP